MEVYNDPGFEKVRCTRCNSGGSMWLTIESLGSQSAFLVLLCGGRGEVEVKVKGKGRKRVLVVSCIIYHEINVSRGV